MQVMRLQILNKGEKTNTASWVLSVKEDVYQIMIKTLILR
jgi:hypothetical protein